MIIEGLTTTMNADGSVNVAPMGPIVQDDFTRLTFRPFPSSITYNNLHRTRCGAFHVVDDVLLLVQTALDLPHDPPETHPAAEIEGRVLTSCCRWYEFVVDAIDESGGRPKMEAHVVHTERCRDFIGFNRARHAVIEAAIAASRLGLLGAEAVAAEIERCRSPVAKTGGSEERTALKLITQLVREQSGEPAE